MNREESYNGHKRGLPREANDGSFVWICQTLIHRATQMGVRMCPSQMQQRSFWTIIQNRLTWNWIRRQICCTGQWGDPPFGNSINAVQLDAVDRVRHLATRILVRRLHERIGLSLDLEGRIMFFSATYSRGEFIVPV